MGHPAKVLPQQDSNSELGSLPLEVVKSRLDASGEGLSSAEAQARLKQNGFNELPEEHTNPITKFLSFFWGPIPWMIEVAAILSALVHHWEDFCHHPGIAPDECGRWFLGGISGGKCCCRSSRRRWPCKRGRSGTEPGPQSRRGSWCREI